MGSSLQPELPTARWPAGLLTLVALGALAAASASGQETVLALEFSFSNPGARSMGFGGAFAALADDATAAFANPAGLTQLVRPEVSLEGRYWGYTTPYTAGGRLVGEPTGIGVDTTAGLRFEESSDSLSGLSFLSFVYPRGRWSLALYRHQLANYEFAGQTNGFIRSVPGLIPGAMERFNEQRWQTEFDIVTYGFTTALRVVESLSLGLGVGYFDGRMLSESQLYKAITLVDPHPFRPEDIEYATRFSIDDSDIGLSGGLLWKLSEEWRLGAFYREGPDFEVRGAAFSGPQTPLPVGTVIFDNSSPVSMPDIYGLGVAYRSRNGRTTVGFEWDRVEYASIIDSIDRMAIEDLPTIDDGDEYHLGGEYVFLQTAPVVALRAGLWLDPEHRLRASAGSDPIVQAIRRPGEDEWHYALGLGFGFTRFQIDVGVDLSELVNTASISAIYSF